MTELAQIRKKAQVTLPKAVREKLGIEEGDFVDFEFRDGEIVIKAKKLVDKDQAWFWTKRWQEGEREADEDIQAGRIYSFPTFEEGIDFLDEQARQADKKKVTKKQATK